MISTALQSPIVANGANGANATEIGRYHLVAELAKGGMGNIYLAVMQGPGGFNKLLVVKELKPELTRDEMYVGMFLDEARLAARMSHPNIVQTNEVGSDGSRHYMVMEFLDGRSLHSIGKRLGGRFPVAAHLRVIAESLLGLHHAHEMRDFDGEPLDIVHRDVSPLNVFITFAGQAKVLDFGIAKALDSTQETKMGVLKGRVAYMAPEQAKGDKVDRRADIYSAGVMIWEAVARRRLWPGYAEVEILTALLREGPRPLRSVCADAPEALDRICARAMAKDRNDRYATAADLLHDLEDHLAYQADAMSIRDVGALVSRAFANEREKMSAVIEEALTRIGGAPRSGTRSKVIPRFRAQLSELPTSTKAFAHDFAKPKVRLATPPQTISPGAVSSFENLSRPTLATNATLGSARSRQLRTLPSKHLGIATAGAAALLMGILFGGRLAVRERQTVASPAATPAPVLPAAAHNDVELVDLVVRVTPSFAQITMDGASLVNNPFHARYPKDNRMHHIVVAADGYESRMEDVSFATDVSIDVSLSRRANMSQPQSGSVSSPSSARVPAFRRAVAPMATSSVSVPDAVASPPPGSPPAENSAAAGRTPLRPITTSNPYGSP